MKKIVVFALTVLPFFAEAQKNYTTKSAKVKFFSHTVAEDVEAVNSQVLCNLNNKSGLLSFAVLIKGFKFENSLMQQHFNEKDYMYSDKFPKATFTGSIINIAAVNFSKNGAYNVTTDGSLTIHGVTQKIKQAGILTVSNNKISLKSTFKIKPKSFGVSVPDGIAETLEITVDSNF